jgi:hypothetical protein
MALPRKQINNAKRDTKKGTKNVSFCVLDGFIKTSASTLERMAVTTGLEPAASSVTAPLADVAV